MTNQNRNHSHPFTTGHPEDYVAASLNYLADTTAKPVTVQELPGVAPQRRSEDFAPRTVAIHDARPSAPDFSLDDQGFMLINQASSVADFYDDEQVSAIYYPEAEQLIKTVTGASRVEIFDHTVRTDRLANRAGTDTRGPARSVHNDYTEHSGPQRVRDLLPDEAKTLLATRVAVVNLWRPIVGPVKTTPIALADASSVDARDWVSTDLVYPDRVGEIYYTRFNPNHRWFYYPDMQPDEVLLIKTYDSAVDGRARFVAHTAFDDPTTAADAPGRESIELRTLVFFEDEPAAGLARDVA